MQRTTAQKPYSWPPFLESRFSITPISQARIGTIKRTADEKPVLRERRKERGTTPDKADKQAIG